MPYPTTILATLQEIGGSTCTGTPTQALLWDPNASIPTYNLTGSGPFNTGWCKQVSSGGTTTWELCLQKLSPAGGCRGTFTFRRDPAADDPLGDYARWEGGQLDPSEGQAAVTEP